MGRRLGYPECCVEACALRYVRRRTDLFARRRADPKAERRPPSQEDLAAGRKISQAYRVAGRPPSQAYLAAREAWVPEPRWQINDLRFASRETVISFEPCSYACDAATRWADAALAAIGAADRAGRVELERALRRDVAIDVRGGRAIVSVDRGSGRAAIVRAEPLRGPGDRVLDEANEQLAPALAGRWIADDGTVPETGDPPVLVIAFGR
jgi:hypothetical protein